MSERPEDASAVAAYIGRFASPPEQEVQAFVARRRSLTLPPGAPFVAQEQKVHPLGFVHEGVLRYHLLLQSGEDVTKDFAFPGWFAASFGSAVSGKPARVAVSAVSACRLSVWRYDWLLALIDTSAPWQRFGRRVAEMLYIRKEEREIGLLTLDAEARYEALLRQFPDALGSIPHYHLASYLGVKPQSLSRIRGRRRSRQGRAGQAGG